MDRRGGRAGAPRCASRRCVARRRERRAVVAVDGRAGSGQAARMRVAIRPCRPARAPDAVAGGRARVRAVFVDVLIAFSLIVSAYFVLHQLSQIVMSPVAARYLWRHQRRYTRRARALAGDLAAPPLVSIVVPAHNEAMTIVDSLRALLALDYESRELVVVNDGSSDGTMDVLRDTFQLVEAPVAFVQPLQPRPVRGLYRSVSEPALVVVDKESGGSKSDAVNAGINAASS